MKAKIKMSDGHGSGRSTGRVLCKSTELKRCSMIEMRWNKYYFFATCDSDEHILQYGCCCHPVCMVSNCCLSLY